MKDILTRLNGLRGELENLTIRRETLRDACQRATVNYGQSRVSGGTSAREDLLVELADLDAEMETCREEMKKQAEMLRARLTSLTGRTAERDAELFRLRYLCNLTWEEVRREMDHQGYAVTIRTLYNWHNAALKRLNLR